MDHEYIKQMFEMILTEAGYAILQMRRLAPTDPVCRAIDALERIQENASQAVKAECSEEIE